MYDLMFRSIKAFVEGGLEGVQESKEKYKDITDYLRGMEDALKMVYDYIKLEEGINDVNANMD